MSRVDVAEWARWGVEHRAEFTYDEIRPMHISHDPLPWTGDCSSFVTLCYFLAGEPDPNGRNYDGEGYTGTLLSNGADTPLSEVEPGDAIVYGPGEGWHTAIVVEAGPDPLTVSMGQQGDPSYVRVSQDGRLPQRYLRFRVVDPGEVPKESIVDDLFISKNPHGPGDYLCCWSTRRTVGIPSGAIEDVLTKLSAQRHDLDGETFAYFKNKETWK